MNIQKNGRLQKSMAWLLSALMVFLSAPFTAYPVIGAETKHDVITGIAGYKNNDTPIVTIPVAENTGLDDIGLPDTLIAKYGIASYSDASGSNAALSDTELADGKVTDTINAGDLAVNSSDTYAVSELKKDAASMSDAIKTGEYLAKIPVTWHIMSGEYGDDSGTWDFKAEWDLNEYPLAAEFNPNIFIRVEQTNLTMLSMLSAGSATEYTVKYDTNGGTPAVIADKTGVQWNDTGLLPSVDLTRTGYRFAGWQTADNMEVTSKTDYATCAGSNYSGNEITLSAVWKDAADITILYKSSDNEMGTVSIGGENGSPVSGPFSGSIATPKDGCHFVNWTDSSNNVATDSNAMVPQKSTDGLYKAETYTAHFEGNSDVNYQVRYYQKDITGEYTLVNADTAKKQGKAGSNPTFEQKDYSGFAFSHATYAATGRAEQGSIIPIAADGTLVVSLYYDRKTYTVTYSANGYGFAVPANDSASFGNLIKEQSVPSVSGYEFNGWYRDSKYTSGRWDFQSDPMPASDITLYAKWTAQSCTVSFTNLNTLGGSLSRDDAQTVSYNGTAAKDCTAAANEGYRFAGWSYDYTTFSGRNIKGCVNDYTTVQILGDVNFTAEFISDSSVEANSINGYVSIAANTADLSNPNDNKSTHTSLSLTSTPGTAYIKYAPSDQIYGMSSITVADKNGNSQQLNIANDGASTTFTPKSGSTVTLTVSTSGGVITATNISDPITVTVEFAPLTASYEIVHYQQYTDGKYYLYNQQSIVAKAGDTISFTPNFYPGFTFETAKTMYSDAFTNPQTTPLTVNANGTTAVSLYYSRNSYKITFDVNGHGTAPASEKGTYGCTITEPAAPSAAGYTFGGWYEDAECSEAYLWDFAECTAYAYDFTLYAKWTENASAEITYQPADETMGSVSVSSETVPPVTGTASGSTAIAKKGYKFVSWTNAAGTVVSAEPYLRPVKDSITGLYTDGSYMANFTVNNDTPYTVKYYRQNTIGVGYTEVKTVNGQGYTDEEAVFSTTGDDGFVYQESLTTYENSDTPAGTTALNISGDGSLIIRLYYDRNSHSVFFNANGRGTAPDSSNVRYGAAVPVPSDLTAVGYTFKGWYKNAGCTDVQEWDFASDTMPDSDITLFAKWEINQYTVTFKTNGGSAVTAVTADYGTPISTPGNPTREGYTFAGWYADEKLNTEYSFINSTIPASNITIYAKWSVNHYTVLFNSNGGSTVSSITGDYGTTVSEPAQPVREGFSFAGWYKNSDLSSVWNFKSDIIPVNGTMLYAKWAEKSDVKIVYTPSDAEMGSVSPEYEMTTPVTGVVKGSEAKASTGYHFVNWADKDGQIVSTDAKYVPEKVNGFNMAAVYTANFAINEYDVSFNTNGHGTGPASQKVNYGELASVPTALTETGYVFEGWYKEAACTNVWDFASDKVIGDTILFAKWTANTYIVSFNANGHGTAPADQSVDYNGLVKAPVTLTETGYIFDGWYKETAGINAWDFTSDKVNGNMTLYAKWTKQSSKASGSNAESSGSSNSSSSSTGNTSGTWVIENSENGIKWQFKMSDGTFAKNAWVKTGNHWYHFDSNGYAQTGWVLDNGKWYHCDPNTCAMDTGLYHDDTDGQDYYLNPDGSMATGWVTIDGKQYYFNPDQVAATYTYDPVTQTWIWNGADAIPYGAMLKNTKTPDGHHVDETGARID